MLSSSHKQQFACGFHFRHGLRLPFGAVLSVGIMGPYSVEDDSFKTVKGLVDYV